MLARQRLIPLASSAEWTSALTGLAHAFGHTWDSCAAMALTTGMPTFLYVWESESGRAICPLAERSFAGFMDVVTPYGFSGFVGIGDTSGMPADWLAFARSQGYVCGYIGMNPLLADLVGFDPADVHEYNDVHVLDLRRPVDSLFAALSRNRKRQVRASEAAPNILLDPERNAAFLRQHHEAFFRRKRAAAVYRFSDATLRRILELPNTLLIGAGTRGAVEAVWLFTYTPWVAESFMAVSLPGAQHHATALIWHGVLELQRRGIACLNLGGGVQRGDGVAHFKQRFGGSVLPLRALKQVYRPEPYTTLCMTIGADANDRAGYFPPYQRPSGYGTLSGNASPGDALRGPACS